MISVCMASFNGAKYIRKQIDSILSQLDEDDELIISDDGSEDSTLEIISSYTDSRIKLLHHKKNFNIKNKKHSKGFFYASENFENSLKSAKGDFIFLADQDDIWKPKRKEKMLQELHFADCVMCNFSVIDSEDKIVVDKFYSKNPISKKLLMNVLKSKFLGCCMAFNKKILDYALPFPKFLIGHDYWIGCIAIKKYTFRFINEPYHLYRRSDSNVSSSSEKSTNSILYRIYFRYVFLRQLQKHFKIKGR